MASKRQTSPLDRTHYLTSEHRRGKRLRENRNLRTVGKVLSSDNDGALLPPLRLWICGYAEPESPESGEFGPDAPPYVSDADGRRSTPAAGGRMGPIEWVKSKLRPAEASSPDVGFTDRLRDPLGFMGYDSAIGQPAPGSRGRAPRSPRRSGNGGKKSSGKEWGRRPDDWSSSDASRSQGRWMGQGKGQTPVVQGHLVVQGQHPEWADCERGYARGGPAAGGAADNPHRYTMDGAANEDVYIVKQRHGYCSIAFSAIQAVVVIIMMWQCGIAPLNINPMIGPYPDALNYWGAKNAVLIIEDGEWWRLITPIFLHAGVIHLLCNASVQLETGAFFECEWGSGIWLIIYISSALGSSILSSCFMPDSISVGSSGAVMGLFGAKLSEVFCRACESRHTCQGRIGHEVRMEQLSGVLCSVTLVGLFSFIPYVDWAAHLGGLVAGMMVGLVTFSFSIESRQFVVLWCVVGVGMTIVAFVMALRYMYNEVEPAGELRDVCEYYKRYFDDYECNCELGD